MPELATLRICRPTRLQGFANALVIEMDGRELTRLRNGRNWASHVEPGRHILRVRQWWRRQPPLELVLAPGDDMRLETRVSAWTGVCSLVRADGATTSPSARPPAPLPALQVLGVTETHRSEELIGTDTRQIGNTAGAGRLTRTIRVTKEWNRLVSVDLHGGHSISAGAQIGPNWLALRTSIEQSLEHTYAISVSRREEFAEEITVEIEPGADITVILTWKRIWQHGLAHVLTQGHQADVPYRMAVGVTFDQAIR